MIHNVLLFGLGLHLDAVLKMLWGRRAISFAEVGEWRTLLSGMRGILLKRMAASSLVDIIHSPTFRFERLSQLKTLLKNRGDRVPLFYGTWESGGGRVCLGKGNGRDLEFFREIRKRQCVVVLCHNCGLKPPVFFDVILSFFFFIPFLFWAIA